MLWLKYSSDFWSRSVHLHNTPEFHYSAFKSYRRVINVQYISIQWWVRAGRQVLMILWGLTYLFMDSLQPNSDPISKCTLMPRSIFLLFWCILTTSQARHADTMCQIESLSSFFLIYENMKIMAGFCSNGDIGHYNSLQLFSLNNYYLWYWFYSGCAQD